MVVVCVALINKETFPRNKICGDAISGSAFKAKKRNPDWAKRMKLFADKKEIRTSKKIAPREKTIALD